MRFQGKAILFDFDGVIIDSEPVYVRHWQRWADKHDVSLDHILSVHHGIPAVRTISIVAPHLDAEHESGLFQVLCSSELEGLVAHVGIRQLLANLPANQWAIATSSNRKIVLSQLAYLSLPHPKVLITIEDVEHGKPAPDPYLLAAKRLGYTADKCVVIEDAPAGIAAAKAAGATVIGVASTKSREALEAADVVVDRLLDLQVESSHDGVQISIVS